MSCTVLTPLCAKQEGSIIPIIAFTDSAGSAVTPSSAFWRLVDADGNVVNSRTNENIASLDTSVEILLEGDDLPWTGVKDGETSSVYLYVSSTYTESGVGVTTQTQEVEIKVQQLRGTV